MDVVLNSNATVYLRQAYIFGSLLNQCTVDITGIMLVVYLLRPGHLFVRGRAELPGLLGGDGGGHVERQHQLVVAELLVVLQLGDEAVGEGDDGLDAVLQLAVAEVVQQLTHLGRGGGTLL